MRSLTIFIVWLGFLFADCAQARERQVIRAKAPQSAAKKGQKKRKAARQALGPRLASFKQKGKDMSFLLDPDEEIPLKPKIVYEEEPAPPPTPPPSLVVAVKPELPSPKLILEKAKPLPKEEPKVASLEGLKKPEAPGSSDKKELTASAVEKPEVGKKENEGGEVKVASATPPVPQVTLGPTPKPRLVLKKLRTSEDGVTWFKLPTIKPEEVEEEFDERLKQQAIIAREDIEDEVEEIYVALNQEPVSEPAMDTFPATALAQNEVIEETQPEDKTAHTEKLTDSEGPLSTENPPSLLAQNAPPSAGTPAEEKPVEEKPAVVGSLLPSLGGLKKVTPSNPTEHAPAVTTGPSLLSPIAALAVKGPVLETPEAKSVTAPAPQGMPLLGPQTQSVAQAPSQPLLPPSQSAPAAPPTVGQTPASENVEKAPIVVVERGLASVTNPSAPEAASKEGNLAALAKTPFVPAELPEAEEEMDTPVDRKLGSETEEKSAKGHSGATLAGPILKSLPSMKDTYLEGQETPKERLLRKYGRQVKRKTRPGIRAPEPQPRELVAGEELVTQAQRSPASKEVPQVPLKALPPQAAAEMMAPEPLPGAEVAIVLNNNQFFPSRIRLREGQPTRLVFTTLNKKPAALVIESLQVQRWLGREPASEQKRWEQARSEINREISLNRVTEVMLEPRRGRYPFHDAMTGAAGELIVE